MPKKKKGADSEKLSDAIVKGMGLFDFVAFWILDAHAQDDRRRWTWRTNFQHW
jgi:hypothetical protein